ncbi:hypothetical protein [Craterilacuibacter sp.]|uniref:hypothetical protein n=1 Tax=Craterilacuibacter sp. TaxID=2870909 RepID=UPI003F360370
MPAQPYTPISCDYHSELEWLALQKKICHIVYLGTDGSRQQLQQRITDIVTSEQQEFILLDDGSRIRLDALISVDGKLRML